nr:hypothetical protein [Tanacetum cinerariifolium]GEX21561.1 hypothetical protein [Tanacetum cinerariifolium]
MAMEEYSPMLYQTPGLTLELEQSLLLGRREGIPDRCGLADECPQGRDAGCGHILPRGRTGAGYASTNCHSLTADIDLFNLIRAPNPTKVKIGSRPRAPHEVPPLTLTAPRVIEMDEPAATDSSGVPSIIERSSLDFAHEAGASDQGVAAPEMPSSEDVPATAAPGAGQAEETATMDPHAAPESRSSHGGKSLAAIQLGLASTVVVPEDAPMGVSDPDPLSLPTLRHAILLTLPSIVAARDPESENASSPAEVAMGSQLRLRFEQEAKLVRKSVAQVARRDKRIQARELEIRNLEASLEAEANAKRAAEDKSAGLSQELERMQKLKAAFEEFKRQQDERVEQLCAEMDARLDALSIDFDEELYPHMLTAIAGRRQAFADAVSAEIAKGLSEGLRHGLEHGQARRRLESIDAYDLEAEAKFVAALQALKDLKCPLVDQLEGLRDAPMDVIMAFLSDGVSVSAPTVVPQGLALLLVDAATQTEFDGT